MATSRILLDQVLSDDEVLAIDRFGEGQTGAASLPALSTFLKRNFDMDLVLDPDIVVGYANDSSNLPGRADGLCRPTCERDCAVLMRACTAARVSCTVSAGRSNLTGSATPEGGILLSTARMMGPGAQVDEEAMHVSVPVGMILEDLRRAVLDQTVQRCIFPVDPTSRTDATVGGAVACNASGFTPGDVGAMRPWVEGVDLVLPDGMVVRATRGRYVSENGAFTLVHGGCERHWPVPRHARPAIKNAGGPYAAPSGVMDIIDLVVGSEGLFGVVAGCRLRLARRPSDYLDLFFSLADEQDAVHLGDYLRARLPRGMGTLSAFEYFGAHCRRHMAHEESLFLGENPVGVYIQVPLDDQEAETAAEEWLDILMGADCGIREDAIILMDRERERQVFMEARHSMPANAVEIVQRRGTVTIMTDTVVPPEAFGVFLKDTHALLAAENMDYLCFGHLGDCHLHFTMLPERDQAARAVDLYDQIVARSAQLGGVYSGEHGTGKRKCRDFLRCYGHEAAEGVRRCKAAVDPLFLLNGGNVIPVGDERGRPVP